MTHFDPLAAHEFLKSTPEALFVDCRSEMEYLVVGHPLGAIHIAWQDGPGWEINTNFVSQVGAAAASDRPIVLICRSGKRSVGAGLALAGAEFTRIYNVLHGFEGELDAQQHRGTRGGWRYDGLPWEQS